MFSLRRMAIASAVLAVAHGQGVILKAQGAKGSPASLSLLVNADDQSDANLISQAEISTNVVNECGRTLLAGNIDIGENTENALAANQVTQVTKGSDVKVTIRPTNDTGAGPFSCDMDLTGNSNGATGQTNLTTSESDSKKNGDITLTVTMPDDMQCIGASTGDVCTVRCRNANEFGGCFAVQQTDTTPNQNTPANIATAQDLKGITAQVQQNIADLPAAVKAIAESGSDPAEQGTAVVQEIQAADPATDGLADQTTGNGNTGNTNSGNKNSGNTNSGNTNAGNTNTGNANAGTGNTGNSRGNGRAGGGRGNRNNNRKRRVHPSR
ncbi:hypothetical protein F5B20DRAFT_158547 [Whalleya microplaca]|nr:hypothetical protein F5B20DRAFT_158547 [Whalleya microplaca]